MQASPLDLISYYMDAEARPLDFGLVLRIRGLDEDRLIVGQISAQRRYPLARSRLSGNRWIPEPGPLLRWETSADPDKARAIDAFMDRPLDPAAEVPFRQLFAVWSGETFLVTRFHHAAADLMSAVLFLQHQLDVAAGRALRRVEDAPFTQVRLQTHPAPVRKSKFAHAGPSERLFCRRDRPGRRRRFHTVQIDRSSLAPLVEGRGFTYNDLLGRCLLLAVRRFNDTHGAGVRRLSLWFPLSIRESPFEGFGNGSSRIRIYEDALAGAFADSCRAFRAQVEWSKAHGEWAVPSDSALLHLPERLKVRAIRAYLSRPWVDMGTVLFSHAERLPMRDPFPEADDVEVIAELSSRHPVGVGGLTHRDRTRLTFTWDPAMLDERDLLELVSSYELELGRAKEHLA